MYVYTRKHVLTMAIYVSISKVASLYAHIIFKTFVTILKMANVIESNPYNTYRERSILNNRLEIANLLLRKHHIQMLGKLALSYSLKYCLLFCIYPQIGLSNKERKCKALKTAFCNILI